MAEYESVVEYIEILDRDAVRGILELKDVLIAILEYESSYIWSIQFIWAMGAIDDIVRMVDGVDFEEYCRTAEKGFIASYDVLCELSARFEQVIDITIIGCKSEDEIPRAYKTPEWEKECDVIITRHDSTLWEFYARDPELVNIFRSLREKTVYSISEK